MKTTIKLTFTAFLGGLIQILSVMGIILLLPAIEMQVESTFMTLLVISGAICVTVLLEQSVIDVIEKAIKENP